LSSEQVAAPVDHRQDRPDATGSAPQA